MSIIESEASFVSTHGVSKLYLQVFEDGSAVAIMEDSLNDESQRMALSAQEMRVMREALNAMIGDKGQTTEIECAVCGALNTPEELDKNGVCETCVSKGFTRQEESK